MVEGFRTGGVDYVVKPFQADEVLSRVATHLRLSRLARGDMPASLQVKLLRVLEDGCVTPVGASQPRKVDIRIIAAINADLDARIAAGTFRQDLYFRLAR